MIGGHFRYIAANTHPDHDTIAAFVVGFCRSLVNLRWPALVRQPDGENKQCFDVVVVSSFRLPASVFQVL